MTPGCRPVRSMTSGAVSGWPGTSSSTRSPRLKGPATSSPIRLSGSPPERRFPPPDLDQHGEEIRENGSTHPGKNDCGKTLILAIASGRERLWTALCGA